VTLGKRASIIIPSWNGQAYLQTCLDSLFCWLAPQHEVVVVDNGSTDGTVELAARYAAAGRIRLIQNPINSGFSRAVNQGLGVAGGETLILLNQDTVSPRDWLTPLLDAMATDRRIGIAGCRLLYPDGRVQHAGGSVNARGEGAHFTEDPPLDANGLADVAFVTGACLAITRACLGALGRMDEGFGRAYFEDVDWCYRARHAGYRVAYCARAELVHAERSAAASGDLEGMANYQGNRVRFVVKHYPIDVLASVFLADERKWLRELGPAGARLGVAMQRVYYRHCLGLRRLAHARAVWAGVDLAPGEIDTIARTLATLRATAQLETNP
jgi:GT2 family glycosyltransferase